MAIAFTLSERLAGFSAQNAKPGDRVSVICRESLTSHDGTALTSRLEGLDAALFRRIPNVPPRSQIDTLLVVIKPSLQATAYVNELRPTATVRVGRAVAAGEPIFVSDVLDMLSFDPGVDIPPDCGLVLVRSHGWRKSLFYDLCPLHQDEPARAYDLRAELAKQTLRLMTGKFTPPSSRMKAALQTLTDLLAARCDDEEQYQLFFQTYPWVLGGQHTRVERHQKLDDKNIPDFTGVRSSDGFRDIFEIKQPFLQCFRQDGDFTAELNQAWNQAERYLTFVRRQREYLRDQKNLVFENPRCFLFVGHGLSPTELRAIRDKETLNPAITALTCDHVLSMATAFVELAAAAGAP